MIIGESGVSMQRRDLLKQLGAAGAAAVGFSGVAVATSGPDLAFEGRDIGVDRRIDVSDRAGAVPLAELLDPTELDGLSEDLDPWATRLQIGREVDSIQVESDCCVTDSCCEDIVYCYCSCCWCKGCDSFQ